MSQADDGGGGGGGGGAAANRRLAEAMESMQARTMRETHASEQKARDSPPPKNLRWPECFC